MPTVARVDHARVRELAALNWSDRDIAEDVGCSPLYARQIRIGRMKRRSEGGSDQSRMEPKSLKGSKANRLLPFDQPAFMEGRTLYPQTVKEPDSLDVLKSGFNSAKIGCEVTKGKWRGFPVYTLTLEERATCPRSCKHWRSCYGNGMQMAHRYKAGPELEQRLWSEVHRLGRFHPSGFVVRLHVLGDFYSPHYVALWGVLLDRVPQLHVFGYSARWDKNDETAVALINLVRKEWDRFAIRFSNAPVDECSTVSIEHPYQKPADAVICPQQLGQTKSCSTCGLCWQSRRRIAFIQH